MLRKIGVEDVDFINNPGKIYSAHRSNLHEKEEQRRRRRKRSWRTIVTPTSIRSR